MAQAHRKIPEMEFSGNVSEHWRVWKQKFQIYQRATKGYKDDEEDQVATLLHFIGDEGLSIFNTFDMRETENKKIQSVLDKFDEYCNPRKNLIYEQSVFFTCSQQEGEAFDHFLTNLKVLAATCEFGSMKKQLLTLRVVLGIWDKGLKERLLRVSDLTLEKAADFCRAAEASRLQAQAMEEKVPVEELLLRKNESPASVQVVGLHKKTWSPRKEDCRGSGPTKAKDFKNSGKKEDDRKFNCSRCGYRHSLRQCPAYQKTCLNCKESNHFAKMCPRRKKVEECRMEDEESEDEHNTNLYVDTEEEHVDEFYVSSLTQSINLVQINCTKTDSMWLEEVSIQGTNVNCKIDTGAEVSVLPWKVYDDLKLPKLLEKTSIVLVAFGNSRIKPVGTVKLECKHVKDLEGKPIKITFVVVNQEFRPLLGLRDCMKLGVVQKIDTVGSLTRPSVPMLGTIESVLEENKSVFSGLGCMPGKYKITLEENCVPVIHPPRRIPVAMLSRLKLKLEELEAAHVIEKITKPTDWVHNLVIVEKANGTLRLCLDPVDLNRVIKREHYPIPNTEDVIAKLANMKVFSIVDMRDGFFQILLDEQSSELCTFNSPFGRYKFLRLPFGVKSAPEVFQRKNMENFGHIPGVQVIFDDIIVAGTTEEEHDCALRALFKRAQDLNIRFNPSKFQYKVDEVKYMGHIMSAQGLKVDGDRVKAILEMPSPTNVTELKRFMGVLNYVSKFIPNLSSLSTPLRMLLRRDVPWEWNHEHAKAETLIKEKLCSSPVLTYYDPTKELVLQTDASQSGLGACLMQGGQPIAYASRSMTDAESRHSQIEKELAGIVFGVKKFHYYVYGRRTVIQTDHKPLVSIVSKNINKVSPRLQRLQLNLVKYDLDVRYVPGSQMYVADTLSRAALPETGGNDPEEDVTVHSIAKHLAMSKEKREEFKIATANYETAQILKDLDDNGWPDHKYQVPTSGKYYWNIRDQLSFSEGLVFVGDRVLVPPNLRKAMLDLLHEGHLGIEKTKSRARQVLFWPGMTKEIEDKINNCEICRKFRKKNGKEPLIPHPIPDRPWEVLATDILEFQGNPYLVIKDFYSKWIELLQLRSKSANEIINKFKAVFSRHGIPDKVVSDNVPFGSREFKEFAGAWNFNTVTSSPRYPQSNGMAENGVKIAKTMLKKAHYSQTDIYLFLLEYRNTPITGTQFSPSQLLLSRQLKTKIPAINSLLEPEVQTGAREILQSLQTKQKLYYDKGSRSLPPLEKGETIMIREDKVWTPAKVVEKSETPRSYVVRKEDSGTVRRNRRDLMKVNGNPENAANHPHLDVELPMEVAEENPSKPSLMLPQSPAGTVHLPVIVEQFPSPKHSTRCPGDTVPVAVEQFPSPKRSTRLVKEPIRFKDYVKH